MNLKTIRNTIAALAVAFIPLIAPAALPGVRQYIQDTSGEYVYYRDYTFKTDSIIGFIYYDEGTYGVRYYAPENEKTRTPAKDIMIYVTVDRNADKMILTGESIKGASDAVDADLINYLHDLLYELNSRRQKIDMASSSKVKVEDDYVYFGGKVQMLYNPLVPMFNLESISDAGGSPLFVVETTGIVTSNGDTSFADYKGITGLPKDKKRHYKKTAAEPFEISFGTQKMTIDSTWKTAMENMWLLDDYAILSITEMNVPGDMKEKAPAVLARRYSLSTAQTYSLWNHSKIVMGENSTFVMTVTWQPDADNVTRSFKIVTRKSDGACALMTLTVFDSVYQKNRQYFDGIIKTYSAE